MSFILQNIDPTFFVCVCVKIDNETLSDLIQSALQINVSHAFV